MTRCNAGWLKNLTASDRRASIALVVIALLGFLPGYFALPAIDRDEARYAQATRQMVASGDYVDIRLQEEPRYKKPIGIYWLQSAFVGALGENGTAPIWVHRLPSLLGAVAATLLTFWIASVLAGRTAAFLAAALMAASVILGVEARLAKTDAVLLATILVAQGVLARAYLAWKTGRGSAFSGYRTWLMPALFWVAVAAGILVKGPVILAFVGLTVVSLVLWEKSIAFFGMLRPLSGVLLCLCLVLPWFVAIGIRSEGDFFWASLATDGLAKVTEGQEGHGAPPLTHLAWFWPVFWPGSLFLALSVREIWRRRGEPQLRFLIAWVVPAWIFFELAGTKLPHYLLPVFPAIAIAAALVLTSRPVLVGQGLGLRLAQLAIAIAAAIATGAAIAAAWFAHGGPTLAFAALGLTALVVAAAVLACLPRWLAANDRLRFSAGLIAATIASYWLIYPSLARIELLWPAARIAEVVEHQAPCERPYLVSAGYGEPSLVFNTRTDIVLAGGAGAADALQERDCALAMIEKAELDRFRERAAEHGLRLEEVGQVSGFNPGQARWISLVVFRAAP